jgi:hypothetical protein
VAEGWRPEWLKCAPENDSRHYNPKLPYELFTHMHPAVTVRARTVRGGGICLLCRDAAAARGEAAGARRRKAVHLLRTLAVSLQARLPAALWLKGCQLTHILGGR